jgi:hypothetical protein
VFPQAEEVDLLVFLVPIATNALKTCGAIGETVCTYRNHAMFDGYELAVHEKFFCIHFVVCGK